MSITSLDRKKHQRYINKYIRKVNKNIVNDDLWRGRFVIRQVGSPSFYIYEDKSGADLVNVHLVITDLLDGHEVHCADNEHDWCFWGGHRIWELANKAITEYFNVWTAENDPRSLRDNPNYDFNNPKVREMWKAHWDNPIKEWTRGYF